MHNSEMYSDPTTNVDLANTGWWPMTTSHATDENPPALGMVIDFTPVTMEIHNVYPVAMILSYN